jgi:hypothetical protein
MSEYYRKPIVKILMLKGKDGDGKGISSISKTGTSGLVDTYTITLTDGTKSTFTVTNGAKGVKGDTGPQGQQGVKGDTGPQGQQGVKGQDGQSIKEIKKASTSGLTDTYEISLTDGTKKSFTVSNGKGIKSIAKTSTSGLVDTYTITYNDGTTSTFTVKNGESGKEEWETILDYTASEELAVTDTYHDVMDVDATTFQKIYDAKKIIFVEEFKAPSVKMQDSLGDIKISLRSDQGWDPLIILNGNYLPNLTSGDASETMCYKEIDLTSICELGNNPLSVVYAPIIFSRNNLASKKIDEYFSYVNKYNKNTTLRIINKKVPVGKGSRIRLLVMS